MISVERVRDVCQEDETEHDVLVLRRIQWPRSLSAAAQTGTSSLDSGPLLSF